MFSSARIGEACIIGQNMMIGPEAEIGRGCKIQNNVSVYKGVTLEDDVFCGPSMVFTNVYNPRANISWMDQVRAGTVINQDVADHELVVGNPCRRIGWVFECGGRLDDVQCGKCRRSYQGFGA